MLSKELPPLKLRKETRERASLLFGALSHPTRLKIVELLSSGEKTVNEIAATLGISQSGASQHLSILTRSGVLVVEPQGVARYYRIRGPRIVRIMNLIEEFCEVHSLFGDPEGSGEVSAENGGSTGPVRSDTVTTD
ncbi:MAG: metalloregulator ArsR/SmtB family transcription factor [Capsulimonadales bacterium]|nr:metalloregulator ArsR/SmtB family transcription factor [Capsulimonadales bacterium]